ncbi:MAG TPA: type 4a pilus biogenesis protein PilO [Candidatus Saccharimonadales bacterium]|nr:type 4a pilus biogenesis protein PilO [Candidatus Saccharimonadales bacterium]
MANKIRFSAKRVAINKANAQIVTIVAVASVLTIFSLVAAKTLWAEQGFQSRLISAKEKARDQLNSNSKAVDSLMAAYKDFESQTTNIIGGSSSGTGSQDGDNATIVLDALPSQYDFPALTSSIQKIADSLNLKISDFSGTDEEVAQQGTQASDSPQAVAMPFSFTIQGANYGSVKSLIKMLEQSIRPIQIQNLTIKGTEQQMEVTIQAQTYYQPGKIMSIKTETIK